MGIKVATGSDPTAEWSAFVVAAVALVGAFFEWVRRMVTRSILADAAQSTKQILGRLDAQAEAHKTMVDKIDGIDRRMTRLNESRIRYDERQRQVLERLHRLDGFSTMRDAPDVDDAG